VGVIHGECDLLVRLSIFCDTKGLVISGAKLRNNLVVIRDAGRLVLCKKSQARHAPGFFLRSGSFSAITV
jgi:hypothetical protein